MFKFGQATPKNPELNAVRTDLTKLKLLWLTACVSPILYLQIGKFISDIFFNPPDQMGFFRMDAGQYRICFFSVVAAAVALQALILWIRRNYDEKMRGSGHVNTMFKLYTKRTFRLMAISEAVILAGAVLFLLNGRLDHLFAFGIVGMVFYAQSYPSESGLNAITKML